MTNITPIFSIPLFQIKVSNWDKKKTLLLGMLNNTKLDRQGVTMLSDFFTQDTSHIKHLSIIFKDELSIFSREFGRNLCVINNAWFETSLTHDFHPVHNHGQLGYSAVCYINYDKNEHTPTNFISPFNHFDGGDMMYHVPIVSEGDLIIFPSSLAHYTKPNNSKKERTIVSFNLRF